MTLLRVPSLLGGFPRQRSRISDSLVLSNVALNSDGLNSLFKIIANAKLSPCSGSEKYVDESTTDLKNVISRPHVRHVNPLTIDIVAVGIPAAHRDTLVAQVVTGKALLDT